VINSKFLLRRVAAWRVSPGVLWKDTLCGEGNSHEYKSKPNNKIMTKDEAEKYREYPKGSGGRMMYDMVHYPFSYILEEYYSNPDYKEWLRWYALYIEPAFDEMRHDEMIKNFGYLKKELHDFREQYVFYKHLKEDKRLTDDIRKFIGFMAGVGFFDKYHMSLDQWFEMKNWHNPNVESPEEELLMKF
jgi:hypothetical protein